MLAYKLFICVFVLLSLHIVCGCVRACVRACARARVHVCVCVFVFVHSFIFLFCCRLEPFFFLFFLFFSSFINAAVNLFEGYFYTLKHWSVFLGVRPVRESALWTKHTATSARLAGSKSVSRWA